MGGSADQSAHLWVMLTRMTESGNLASLYLETVKHALNGDLHGAQTIYTPVRPRGLRTKVIAKELQRQGLTIAKGHVAPEETYATGVYWEPGRQVYMQESMIGMSRLNNIQQCVETVLRDQVPGDLIETGVWRGGATIFMRAILAARGDESRQVFVADSFEGLPAPSIEQDAAIDLHEDQTLAVSREQVAAAFERYGLLDDRVHFVKGWFRDSLPALKGHQWSTIRLDGDMYESTMDALENLYDSLSPGGFAIIDDYFAFDECRAAVADYRGRVGSTEQIIDIDGAGAYWRKA